MIDFEAYAILEKHLEWKVIYIGSANSCEYDQVLESFSFPVEKLGSCNFNIDVRPPDHRLIPTLDDLLGATLLMISAIYDGREFFRCSYFVYNNFDDQGYSNTLSTHFRFFINK